MDPQHRELERRLHEAEEALRQLRAIHDHSPDAILEIEPSGRIVSANGTATEALGADLVGQNLGDLLLDPLRRPCTGLDDREVRLRDRRTMSLRAVPRPDGRPGVIASLRDVTERAALRDEIESARRAAAVARISGGIAHEINNPLTVLQLRTDLLLEERMLPESLRQQLGVIRESVTRIARIVRTLQMVGLPLDPTAEWIAIGDLAANATRAVRSGTGSVRLAPGPSPAIGVRGSPTALALAMEQLVSAAAESGGGQLRIVPRGERVRVEIHVESARLPEGPIEDLGASAIRSDERFPGIGLVVAARIAREHGGELWAGRELDHGLLRLELPIATLLEEVTAPLPSRILVVDDEPLVGQVLAEWGKRTGHEVEVVRTAELAMALLEQDLQFDAILCDDRLPGSSGRQLLLWLRQAHPTLARRFALMSGAPKNLEGVRFLPKPFTRPELGELLDALLQDR